MAANIEEMKDVRIKELSTSIVTTDNAHSKNRYSYIELADGSMLKNVEVQAPLTGKLQSALRDGTPIDIHIMRVLKNEIVILAIRTADGRLFASDIPELPFLFRIFPLILALCGFPMLLFFGFGLIIWWGAWKVSKEFRLVNKMRNYVRSLPDAILLD